MFYKIVIMKRNELWVIRVHKNKKKLGGYDPNSNAHLKRNSGLLR